MLAVAETIDSSSINMELPSYWVEGMRIVLANGEIYSFEKRPYLITPLDSQARLKCVRKARGLGFSETFIQDCIHGLSHGIYNQGVQYVFPTETAMREFVQSRFNVILKRNSGLRRIVQDTDTTYYKRVGRGNLFLNGGSLTIVIEGLQKESMSFRGKQIDKGLIDELDMFEQANDVVGSVMTSMKNSTIKAVTAISNPSVPNYGIDKLFQQSNQMYWYRQCLSCKELTCPDKEFPSLIDEEGCHCWKCGGLLSYKGQWRADRPERNDLFGIRSKDWEGYHISDLSNPNDDPFTIWERYQDKSESNQEKLHKFSLGLPFMATTDALTLNEIYECCGYYPEVERLTGTACAMGVDVGSRSGFHVVIGYRTGKDSYEIIRLGCLESFEDVKVIGHRMGVKNCVCDMQPEVTAARRLQKEAGFPVWLCAYQHTNPVDEVVWDEDNRTVKVYRNSIFDASHRVVSEKRLKLPMRSRKIEEFARQYVDPVKVKEEGKHGIVYRYMSRSKDDHYRNTMNYFLLAAQTSRILRNKTYKKESRLARHDTVKI